MPEKRHTVPDKDKSINKQVPTGEKPSKPFNKLNALMHATFKTRGPDDDKEALKAILDSEKQNLKRSNKQINNEPPTDNSA